jgi:hypothetical protein
VFAIYDDGIALERNSAIFLFPYIPCMLCEISQNSKELCRILCHKMSRFFVIFGLWKFIISKGHNMISILLIFSCYVDVHAHVACRVEMKILVFAFSRKLIIAPREKFHTKIDENDKKISRKFSQKSKK